MNTRRKYAYPPVQEALGEIYFDGSRWDDTVPGRFYDRVLPLGFSRRETAREATEVMDHAPDAERYGASSDAATRMRFHCEPERRVLQVGRDLVIVNQLRPYPRFEAWAPTITNAARIYTEIAEPRGIARLALRYINRVTLPAHALVLQDHFLVGPVVPPAWNDEHGPFLLRVEKPLAQGLRVLLTFGSSAPAEPSTASFLLDIYAISNPAALLDPNDLHEPLARLHDATLAAFESSITDRLRANFGVATTT